MDNINHYPLSTMITQSLINAFFKVNNVATDVAGNVIDIVSKQEADFMKSWVTIDERFGVAKDNYAINRYGEVLNLKFNKKLKHYYSPSSGYMCVSLNRATDASGNLVRPNSGYGRKPTRETPRPESLMLVHRLVAMVFISNSNPRYKIVDHIDGNKFNNNYRNLRWCNQRVNANNMKNNTKYWSVRWSKGLERWGVVITTTVNNNPRESFSHNLGSFDDEQVAARAVKKFMIENYPREMGGGRRFIED